MLCLAGVQVMVVTANLCWGLTAEAQQVIIMGTQVCTLARLASMRLHTSALECTVCAVMHIMCSPLRSLLHKTVRLMDTLSCSCFAVLRWQQRRWHRLPSHRPAADDGPCRARQGAVWPVR